MRRRKRAFVNASETIELRRVSVQLAGQLPAGRAAAIYVLDYARKLVDVMHEPEKALGRSQVKTR